MPDIVLDRDASESTSRTALAIRSYLRRIVSLGEETLADDLPGCWSAAPNGPSYMYRAMYCDCTLFAEFS